MMFLFAREDQLNGDVPFFHGRAWASEMNGMVRRALKASRDVDSQSVAQRFEDTLGAQHRATLFWRYSARCKLSTWSPPEPWAGIIERGLLEPGIFAPDRVPWVWNEDAYTVLNGSRLYGFEDDLSDWDTTILADSLPIHEGTLSPSTRAFHTDTLVFSAGRGNRHALELLFAPEPCILSEGNKGKFIEDARNIVLATLRPEAVLDWHDKYSKRYRPVAEGLADQHDRFVERWTMEAGWPYKVGYFLLIDALIARWFCSHGVYELRTPFQDQDTFNMVLQCKQGKMTMEEWQNAYDSLEVKELKCSSM